MDSALITQVISVNIHFSKPQIKIIVVFYRGKLSYLHNNINYHFKKNQTLSQHFLYLLNEESIIFNYLLGVFSGFKCSANYCA